MGPRLPSISDPTRKSSAFIFSPLRPHEAQLTRPRNRTRRVASSSWIWGDIGAEFAGGQAASSWPQTAIGGPCRAHQMHRCDLAASTPRARVLVTAPIYIHPLPVRHSLHLARTQASITFGWIGQVLSDAKNISVLSKIFFQIFLHDPQTRGSPSLCHDAPALLGRCLIARPPAGASSAKLLAFMQQAVGAALRHPIGNVFQGIRVSTDGNQGTRRFCGSRTAALAGLGIEQPGKTPRV